MKHRVPYLIIALIILLIVIIFFIPADEIIPIPVRYTEQITTVIKKSDTLNTTIAHLNIKINQLKTKDIAQQEKHAQRIRKINTLPVDSQIKIFKDATNRNEKICLKISSLGDTLAEISVNSILKANKSKAIFSGETDFNSLCKEISDASSVNKGDILAVLYGCIRSMSRALSEGKIVRLGDFGSFQIGISSEGTLCEKAFNSKKITKAKILFRPGEDLSNMLKVLTFQKIQRKPPFDNH